MSRRRRRYHRGAISRPNFRRRSGGGGSRWGIELSDAIPGALLEFVGTALQQQLARYPQLPAAIREAPASALGLYAIGVAFNRPSWRSLGAGQILGRLIGLLRTTP